MELFEGKKIKPSDLIRSLMRLQYVQDIELKRGAFRKTPTEIEIISPTGQEATKIVFKNDTIIKMYRALLNDPEDLETKDLNYEKNRPYDYLSRQILDYDR